MVSLPFVILPKFFSSRAMPHQIMLAKVELHDSERLISPCSKSCQDIMEQISRSSTT